MADTSIEILTILLNWASKLLKLHTKFSKWMKIKQYPTVLWLVLYVMAKLLLDNQMLGVSSWPWIFGCDPRLFDNEKKVCRNDISNTSKNNVGPWKWRGIRPFWKSVIGKTAKKQPHILKLKLRSHPAITYAGLNLKEIDQANIINLE